MVIDPRRAAAALLAVPALAIAGCSSTLDPKSGENLIRAVVTKNRLGTVTSVSCPSGLSPKAGTAFDCKVKMTSNGGKQLSGTITVHIVSGNKVAVDGIQDFSSSLMTALTSTTPGG
jgi:hypothetical protein